MRDINKIVIAGAGTMGASMGETFAKYGFEVTLYDIYDTALEKAKSLIALNQYTEVQEKILTQEESEALLKRIHYTKDINEFSDADFVIEAILEKLDVKHDFWTKVSRIVDEDVILCSNTSGLSISKIAEVVENPQRFAGMHWINPPHIIPLIEIICGEKTNPENAKVIEELALKVNKKPVIVNDAPGFVLNRIQFAIMRECLNIVEQEIASASAVDDVMKYGLGIRYACLGPFQVADLGGLDIFYNISSYLFADLCNEDKPFGLLKDAYQNGNYGVKKESGFYDYSEGKDDELIKYRDKMFTKLSKTLYNDNSK
ncbi:3-hydroxyacyl-CoA dehydrogenase family protein [Eubacteriales bacterium KG127]